LKAVFQRQKHDYGISISSISAHLDTKAASEVEMLKRLADKKSWSTIKIWVQLTETGKAFLS
jgi:Mn-dependent DtxR family transcriptional regulator